MTKRQALWLWLIASACQDDDGRQVHELKNLRVIQGFPEPICGRTLNWIEARRQWLEAATGLPAALEPIEYYWLPIDEVVSDHCPWIACTKESKVFGPLDAISHELVHGHVSRLGVPRPWLVEGLATMLEDLMQARSVPPESPSALLAADHPFDVDYAAAGAFVEYLRERYGMPQLLKLYRALSRVDEARTPEVFAAVMGDAWDEVEADYLVYEGSGPIGSLDCDHPVLPLEEGAWTMTVPTSCDDPDVIGPWGVGGYEAPLVIRYGILEIDESWFYGLEFESTSAVSVSLDPCEPSYMEYGAFDVYHREPVYLEAGRWRLRILVDLADSATGLVRVEGPLPLP